MKNVIITILVILVLGLGGYLVYDKVIDKDNNKFDNEITENDNSLEDIEQNYDLVEAKKLIDKYYYNGFFGGNSFNGYDDGIKFWLVYNSFDQNQIKTVKCEELYGSDPSVTYDGVGYVIKQRQMYCDREANVVSYDAMLKNYKYYFGNDAYLKKEDISQFDYNEKTDSFVFLGCRCGGNDARVPIYGVKTAKIKNNNLVIEVGYYVLKPTENNVDEFYCDLNNRTYSREEVFTDSFEQNFLKENIDKMDTYKFTFVKENDHYILENMIKN